MSAETAAGIYLVALIGAIGLVLLGVFAIVVFRHLIRVILALSLLEGGVNLFLIILSFRPGGMAPIMTDPVTTNAMVDPLPQALVLTAIVIGVSVQALALALVVQTYKVYGTLDTKVLAAKIAEESGTRVVDDIPVHLPAPAPASPLLLEDKSS